MYSALLLLVVHAAGFALTIICTACASKEHCKYIADYTWLCTDVNHHCQRRRRCRRHQYTRQNPAKIPLTTPLLKQAIAAIVTMVAQTFLKRRSFAAAKRYPSTKVIMLEHVVMLASKVTLRSKSGQSRLSCTAALFSKLRSVSARRAGTGMQIMCTCAWLPSRRLSAP